MSKPRIYEPICPRCHQIVGTNKSCTVCNQIPVDNPKVDKKPDDAIHSDEELAHLGRS
jgi:hypothetical protein